MKRILIFLLIPVCTILFQLIYVDCVEQLISSVIFLIVNFGFSIICYKLFNEKTINLRTSKKVIACIIVGLLAVDQILKIIIHSTQADANIIGNYLRIKITKNTNQMAMLNFLDIELNIALVAVIKFLLIVLLVFIFAKFKEKSNDILYAFVLLMSASISNLIDTVAWGYTLDYIYFYRLVCYDLKDFYVDTAIGFYLIVFIFSNSKHQLKDK